MPFGTFIVALSLSFVRYQRKRVYLSGIVVSLVGHTETGLTPRAALFKSAYEKNESIKLMMKGHSREYGKNNPAYTRARIPFRSTWLTYADSSIDAMVIPQLSDGVWRTAACSTRTHRCQI
jgi:hypothetical protein